jgi:hypothetical protein
LKTNDKPQRIRLDCESGANHNLNRLLDKPVYYSIENIFLESLSALSRKVGEWAVKGFICVLIACFLSKTGFYSNNCHFFCANIHCR